MNSTFLFVSYIRLIFPLTAILLSFILLGGSGTKTMPGLYLLKINYQGFNDIRAASGLDGTAHGFTLVGVCGIVNADLENGKVKTVGKTMRKVVPSANMVFDQLNNLDDHGESSEIDWSAISQYTSFKHCTAALFAFLLLTGLSSFSPRNAGTNESFGVGWNRCIMIYTAIWWFADAIIAAALCTVNYRHATQFRDLLDDKGISITAGPAAIAFVWVVVGCVILSLIVSLLMMIWAQKIARKQHNIHNQLSDLMNHFEQDKQGHRPSHESAEINSAASPGMAEKEMAASPNAAHA